MELGTREHILKNSEPFLHTLDVVPEVHRIEMTALHIEKPLLRPSEHLALETRVDREENVVDHRVVLPHLASHREENALHLLVAHLHMVVAFEEKPVVVVTGMINGGTVVQLGERAHSDIGGMVERHLEVLVLVVFIESHDARWQFLVDTTTFDSIVTQQQTGTGMLDGGGIGLVPIEYLGVIVVFVEVRHNEIDLLLTTVKHLMKESVGSVFPIVVYHHHMVVFDNIATVVYICNIHLSNKLV